MSIKIHLCNEYDFLGDNKFPSTPPVPNAYIVSCEDESHSWIVTVNTLEELDTLLKDTQALLCRCDNDDEFMPLFNYFLLSVDANGL